MKKNTIQAFTLFSFIVFMVTTCGSHHLEEDQLQEKAKEQISEDGSGPGFKNLGAQITNSLIQGSAFAKDKSGRQLVYTVVRGTTAHLIGMDVATREVAVDLPLDGTNGSFDIKVSNDGWLYIAGNERNFYKHLPGSNEIINLGEVIPGEHFVWDLAAGKDAEIFGATYPGAKVFRYHPKDGFSDVGKGSLVAGEAYVRSLVYHKKSDKLYAGIGAHAYLVELDPRTGAKREFLPAEFKSEEFVYALSIMEDEVNGDRLLIYLTNSGKTLVYNIKTKVFEGEMPAYTNVKSMIKSKTSNTAYYTQGPNLYYWDLNTNKNKLVGNVGGAALAFNWRTNNVLEFLTFQQRLFEYNMETDIINSYALNIPPNPIQINSIAVGPNNMIWTGGYLNGSNATYNPATGKTTLYEGLNQAESITSLGKYVFFGVYTGSRIFMYDTEQPWNIPAQNPKRVAQIAGQDRPFGSIPLVDLNKVYFGTSPVYGKNGGALVEFDITTNKATTFNQVVYNQSIISFAYTGGLLYGGTSNKGGLGIDPTENEAKLFVWDPVTKTKINEIVPVKDAKAISALTVSPDGNIWGFASGTLFVFDPKTNEVISRKKYFNFTGIAGGLAPGSLVFHPNGKIYCMELRNFFELDPVNLEMTILDKPISHLVMDNKHTLYYSKSSDLWQYTPPRAE